MLLLSRLVGMVIGLTAIASALIARDHCHGGTRGVRPLVATVGSKLIRR
jgi:hypothetical protein